MLLEAAGRYNTAPCLTAIGFCSPHAVAAGVRYQAAMGRRHVFVFEGFGAHDFPQRDAPAPAGRQGPLRIGGRVELVTKF